MKVFKQILFSILGLAALIVLINVFISYKPLSRNKLNAKILDKSFEKGRLFLLNNQTLAGNFNYEYNFVDKTINPEVSQVRQAGALWGLILVHQHKPTPETKEAILKGFQFCIDNTLQFDSIKKVFAYPGETSGKTGTQALYTLALIDFLRIEKSLDNQQELEDLLNGYIQFLLSLRNDDLHFSPIYSFHAKYVNQGNSPYFDGETLLALAKAAKYAGYCHLKDIILESAEAMYQTYVVEARKIDEDSDQTKGFYQWSSMAFYEIYTAGWDDRYAERIIDLAYWMIDTHKTLMRSKNTAYAHEGMIHAWEIARLTGNEKAQKKIGRVIDKGLYKLTTWQVNGPKENLYLKTKFGDDPLATGGIMNYCCDKNLRIDVTQHQMHAVKVAREFIYND
jgi:hypothetical protein